MIFYVKLKSLDVVPFLLEKLKSIKDSFEKELGQVLSMNLKIKHNNLYDEILDKKHRSDIYTKC